MSGGIEDRKASLGKLARRLFSTTSTASLLDPRPTALDLRALGLISLFDGQSRIKGKGAGCYVSNRRLADILGCEYASLSKSIRRLREWGYITEERGNVLRPNDRRMTTYRVEFPEPNRWLVEQLSRPEIVGLLAVKAGKVVGLDESENGEIPPENDKYYTPQRGELDSVETGELNSAKAARQEPRLGSAKYDDRPIGERLALYERALKSNPYSLDLVAMSNWLTDVFEEHVDQDTNIAAWTMRLIEKTDELIEHQHRQGRANPCAT